MGEHDREIARTLALNVFRVTQDQPSLQAAYTALLSLDVRFVTLRETSRQELPLDHAYWYRLGTIWAFEEDDDAAE